MEIIFEIINSSLFKNIIITPLAIVGFWQIFRGVTTIIEKDLSSQDWLKGWVATTYLAITVIGCICLIAQGYSAEDLESARAEGYEAGYSDGRLDALWELEDNYSRGYDDGHSEGYWEGYDDSKIDFALNLIESAEHYAREKTGWSVYEAWNNILIYNDGVDPNGFAIPTVEEYQQSIVTLVYFCEYLDTADFYD